jgi:hypothetical protein
LATFCWTKSLLRNDAFIRGNCFIQSLHFCFVIQEDFVWISRQLNSIPLQPFGRRDIPFGHSTVQASSVWTFLYVEKLQTVPAYICLDVSVARLDATQCSISYGISFRNTDMGRQLQQFRRCVFPFGCAHSFGKSSNQISNVRTTVFIVRTLKLHIWKFCASDKPSGQQMLWSGCAKP